MPVKKSKPPKGAAKPAVVLVEVGLLVVLGIVVYVRFIKSDRADPVAERAAAQKLEARKILVITENARPGGADGQARDERQFLRHERLWRQARRRSCPRRSCAISPISSR